MMDGCDVRAESEAILLAVGPGHRALVNVSWSTGQGESREARSRTLHTTRWHEAIVAGVYVHLCGVDCTDAIIALIFHSSKVSKHNRRWKLDSDGNWRSEPYLD